MVRELIEPLEAAYPGVTFKHQTIMITGDRDRKSRLGGLTREELGAFSVEIERSLLAGDIDIALHS